MPKIKKFRQGDVLIVSVDSMPSGVSPVEGKIVVRGEFTGHSHQFHPSAKAVLMKKGEEIFIKVEEPSVLFHEEHKPIELPVGLYQATTQQELNLSNEIRSVRD